MTEQNGGWGVGWHFPRDRTVRARLLGTALTPLGVLHVAAGLRVHGSPFSLAAAAARLPALSPSLPPRAPSFMLPGSATCGVGLGVTSSRSSVNTGEHVDPIFRRQQRTAACQRHIIGFFLVLFCFLNICSEVLRVKLETKLYKLCKCKENPT